MKKITLALLLFSAINLFAQTKNSQVTKGNLDSISKSFSDNFKKMKLENELRFNELNSMLSKLSKSNDNLKEQIQENNNKIYEINYDLGLEIKKSESNVNDKITSVGKLLTKNSLYGIIGVLSAIILSGLLYWLLRKRQQTDKTDFIEQLSNTKSSIEESLVKEFGKQTEMMDAQLHLIEQQKTTIQTSINAEPDHSLALKVASEINLIERNINLMDSKTKGLKQLQASVGKLKDNLSANGYEMPELLGKQFHQGLKVIVTSSIPDDNLEKDSEIISKVLIPQVNYNDKMIQTAQIETSKGY